MEREFLSLSLINHMRIYCVNNQVSYGNQSVTSNRCIVKYDFLFFWFFTPVRKGYTPIFDDSKLESAPMIPLLVSVVQSTRMTTLLINSTIMVPVPKLAYDGFGISTNKGVCTSLLDILI